MVVPPQSSPEHATFARDNRLHGDENPDGGRHLNKEEVVELKFAAQAKTWTDNRVASGLASAQ